MEYLGALTTILALFIGAFLARGGERFKSQQDKRSAAYAEFIRAQATINRTDVQVLIEKIFSGKDTSPEEWGVFMAVQEQFNVAHSHLLIYGSSSVIRALSNFYDFEDGTNSPEGLSAYLQMIEAMRKDSAAKNYSDFKSDVDNIMISGPPRRRAALFKRIGPSSSTETGH